MNLLITGGAGFIGANLARFLLARPDGFNIRVLDDLSSGSLKNLGDLEVEFIEGSILDEDVLQAATKDIASIVHLAAIPSVDEVVDAARAAMRGE